ncbi:MAG: hypothetical protein COA57_14475 [Flavobacteriales bacterium]|nr:MAG: hypothetical protein COA57_14475 [Flavobacteriales bacterium]
MKRQTIRLTIFLSVILLIVLVATQIFWVSKAYNLQEKQFTYDITYALKNVARQVLLHNNYSAQLIGPVKQISPNAFRVSINDTLHPYYLESMLKSEFRQREINIDFEYSIYDCFTDSVVYTSFASTKELSVQSDKITQTPIKWEKDGFFPVNRFFCITGPWFLKIWS